MALTDTDITTWTADFTGADENTPTDKQLFSGLFDDQPRNIKSVIRAESLNKDWERHGLTPTVLNSVGFSLVGDQRDIAVIGRRVNCNLNGSYIYGTISNSSYSTNTTVTVSWDLSFLDATIAVVDADTLTFTGNLVNFFENGLDNLNQIELWNASYQRAPVKFDPTGSSPSYNGSVTSCNFTQPGSAASMIDFTAFTPTRLFYTPQATSNGTYGGLNTNLTEVTFGPFTPDTFQSGWSHRMIGGSFQITLNNTAGPFLVDLPDDDSGNPISFHTSSFQVQVQSQGIVSGSPNTTAWTKAFVSNTSSDGFEVTLAAAVNAGVVQYDYVIMLDNY